jgi:mycothiol system anti-sigma-R factor
MSDHRACEAYDEELSALLDGELSEERETEVRTHTASCPHCTRRLDALRGVDRLLASAPAPPVPHDLRARLDARIAAEARRRPPRARPPRLRRLGRSALGFAAAAAAAVLALYLGVRTGETPLEDGAPAPQIARTAPPAAIDLDVVPADELAMVLEIETIEDLDVIANLDLLVQLVAVEAGAG